MTNDSVYTIQRPNVQSLFVGTVETYFVENGYGMFGVFDIITKGDNIIQKVKYEFSRTTASGDDRLAIRVIGL